MVFAIGGLNLRVVAQPSSNVGRATLFSVRRQDTKKRCIIYIYCRAVVIKYSGCVTLLNWFGIQGMTVDVPTTTVV